MDFYQELLLTGLISVLIAFLIGKIASIPVDDDEEETDLASPAHIAAGSSAYAVSVHPIAGKEIERNSPPGVASPSGVSFDDSDQAESLCFEVEPQRLDLEKEEFSKEVEVDASKMDESSTEKVGDFVNKEEISVRDEKVEEKVLESGGETEVENEDASAMDEKDGLLLHGEDDWEGIECSDLEKLFGVAAEFVASEKGGNAVCKLSNKVQLQLYGLHKVATEGPCYEPKPMALMVAARSKWHAWQRLGNMSPETAMEEYISLLTNSIPGWMAQPKDNDCKDPVAVDISQVDRHDLRDWPLTCRLVGDSYPVQDATDAVVTGPKFLKDGLTNLFLVNLLSPTRVAF
ncbi:uncharacterized protein LOC141838566 isoform X2 [Curcuma longa]|uniref:uncharacterized protein LOC141838566 isoform X2 n=1 Tax=Curcuma longa TaxID=136217 RepID=UPI003D9F94D0